MKARTTIFTVLLLATFLLAACAPAATPVPTAVPTKAPTAAPTVAPTAVPFDIKPIVTKYIAALPDGFSGIAPAALKDLLAASKPFLLDVREASELTANGFIEGAVNLPIRTLTQNLDKLPAKDQPIVVYCAIGHRGAMAMTVLQMLGYTNVKSLSGGFNAWKAANLPVATGTSVAPVAGAKPAVDAALFAALDKYVTTLPDGFNGIAPAAANDLFAASKPVILDVREASELTANGYINGQVNIPIRALLTDLTKLPADKAAPIIVYCGVGHRGGIALVALNLMGYTNVKSISGGFNAWKAANLPITGAPVPTAVPFDLKAVLTKYIAGLPDGFSGIAPAAAKDQMAAAKVFLLDVREAKELTDNGFIEGAVNIPIRTLTQNLDKLPAKDQPIIVYCAIGHRGGIAMEALQLLGYTNVKSISGGFNAWKAANLPVKTGTVAAPVAGTKPTVDADLFAVLDKYLTGLPDGFSGIAPAALNDQLAAAKPFLLDVREAKELTDNGFIAGAVNVPIRSLITDLAKLPADKAAPIVVYCAIGHRGAIGMVTLQLLGYTNVKSLSGGFNAWKAANLPVAK